MLNFPRNEEGYVIRFDPLPLCRLKLIKQFNFNKMSSCFRLRLYALSRDWVRTRYYRPPPKKMVPSDLPPSQRWDNFATGQYQSPLVPPILPPEPEIQNIERCDLLQVHLNRWKRVAQTWKNQSAGRLSTISFTNVTWERCFRAFPSD